MITAALIYLAIGTVTGAIVAYGRPLGDAAKHFVVSALIWPIVVLALMFEPAAEI